MAPSRFTTSRTHRERVHHIVVALRRIAALTLWVFPLAIALLLFFTLPTATLTSIVSSGGDIRIAYLLQRLFSWHRQPRPQYPSSLVYRLPKHPDHPPNTHNILVRTLRDPPRKSGLRVSPLMNRINRKQWGGGFQSQYIPPRKLVYPPPSRGIPFFPHLGA